MSRGRTQNKWRGLSDDFRTLAFRDPGETIFSTSLEVVDKVPVLGELVLHGRFSYRARHAATIWLNANIRKS